MSQRFSEPLFVISVAARLVEMHPQTLRKYERELKKLRDELQQRSKNLVDKRKLLELEEQKRRAEEDKLQAITELEVRRDCVLCAPLIVDVLAGRANPLALPVSELLRR